MPNKIINEQVDIYQYPEMAELKGMQITIGDLHGNAMKLMFMLVKHGIATNINNEEYNRLVAIYKMPAQKLTRELLNDFNRVLDKIKWCNHSLIRLIGDEFADRGSNDYFTLKILEKLNQHQVPLEILVSNHGFEFIRSYEITDYFSDRKFGMYPIDSVLSLEFLISKGLVTKEEVLEIIEKAYKPNLLALAYSISPDKKMITLYSHAPIGLNTIKELAQEFEVKYKDATPMDLAQSIDQINAAFQRQVQNNTVCSLEKKEAFIFILWNRKYDCIERPLNHFDYQTHFVHGHDSQEPTKGNIYNLDNELGKGIHNNQGDYYVLYSSNVRVLNPKNGVLNQKDQKTKMETLIRIAKREAQKISSKITNQAFNPTTHTEDSIKKNTQPARYNKKYEAFLFHLKQLEKKAKNLEKTHPEAASHAHRLHRILQMNYSDLVSNKIPLSQFRDQSYEALNNARPELEKHATLKTILGNLVLAICLNAFFPIALLINKNKTGKYFFFQSNVTLDALEKAVQDITGPSR